MLPFPIHVIHFMSILVKPLVRGFLQIQELMIKSLFTPKLLHNLIHFPPQITKACFLKISRNHHFSTFPTVSEGTGFCKPLIKLLVKRTYKYVHLKHTLIKRSLPRLYEMRWDFQTAFLRNPRLPWAKSHKSLLRLSRTQTLLQC